MLYKRNSKHYSNNRIENGLKTGVTNPAGMNLFTIPDPLIELLKFHDELKNMHNKYY